MKDANRELLIEATALLYWLAWTLPLWDEKQVEALKMANKLHTWVGGAIPAHIPSEASRLLR